MEITARCVRGGQADECGENAQWVDVGWGASDLLD